MTASAQVRQALTDERVMAILRYPDGGDVAGAINALAAGGIRVLEVTLSTPGAWDAITATVAEPGMLIGAGTVTTTEKVHRLADLGGRFVVSPGLDPDIVSAALDRGLLPLPGVMTGSEVMAARRAGAQLLKLFPAGALGVRYLSEMRGPFGDVAFVATGGIGIDEIGGWLRAGAVAVAIGSDLAGRRAPTSHGELDALTARARTTVATTRPPLETDT